MCKQTGSQRDIGITTSFFFRLQFLAAFAQKRNEGLLEITGLASLFFYALSMKLNL